MIRRASALALLAFLLTLSAGALAQAAPQSTADITQVPAAARPSPSFNPEAATDAYLAMIPPAAKARSNAYFEGGYWLILWDFLYASAIALLLLNLRWSARMRDLAERMTTRKPLQTLLYWVQFLLLTTLLGFPLEVYENFIREHKYGLATQTFAPWMVDEIKALLINLVLGGIAVVVLFAIVRRLRKTWWIWGSAVSFAMLIVLLLIGPVFLQPIFNKVAPLNDPKVTAPILRLARANGIPAKDVYEVDASRQTTRMSANVSGFGKTMRITLNDNLLRRGSPEEIQAVMGHEMGHYVLNHIPKMLLYLLILTVVGFALLRFGTEWALARWGEKWQIRDIGDPAVLPLIFLISGIFFFVLTPINNTEIRSQEKEADMYGLNASRQPDGFAQAAIHLAEYRKMRPGPIEEWLFFDHPSGYDRIHSAMVWKSENEMLYRDQPGAATP